MDVRKATRDDVDGIRAVARASLDASYGHALNADLIDEAVEHWYDAENLVDDLESDDAVFVVAVESDTVVGFAQSYVVEGRETIGEIDWLHVSPDHRGEGLGTQLLKRLELELLDRGVGRIEGRVLAANESGTEFYAEHGFEAANDRTIEIGDSAFVEHLYIKFPEETAGELVLLERRTGPDGQAIYVAYDETERGSLAPFYATYRDRDREERYGYFCGACEGFDTAMDAMGRVECNTCGNRRKATRWDAAYL